MDLKTYENFNKAKCVNMKYTKEQELELLEYDKLETHLDRGGFIYTFGVKHNKNTRSVIAKLSKLEIYKAKPKVSKVTGETARTKIQMVEELCKRWGVDELEGFEKTPKLTLLKILRATQPV